MRRQLSDQTEDVKQLYEAFPYPGSSGGVGPIYDLANLLGSLFGDNDLDGRSILDAGCGTGQRILGVAARFKKAKLLGLDISSASLAAATAAADEQALRNVSFRQENLLRLNLGRRFDIITATGVVHHLTQPAVGLQNLCEHLNDDGLISIWHYHPFGEHERLLHRELLLTLLDNEPSRLEVGLTLMRAMNLHLSDKQYGRMAARPDGKSDQLSIDADAFLHPIVNAYRFDEAIELFRHCSVDWVAVNGVNCHDSSRLLDLMGAADPEESPFCVQTNDLFTNPYLQRRYEALPRRSKLRALELVVRCTGFTIVAGRGQSYQTFSARLQGNVLAESEFRG